MRTLEFVIAPEDEGLTVEQFLRGRQGFPRKRVVKLKHDPLGMLRNGEHARSIDLLQAGDRLTVRFALTTRWQMCMPRSAPKGGNSWPSGPSTDWTGIPPVWW